MKKAASLKRGLQAALLVSCTAEGGVGSSAPASHPPHATPTAARAQIGRREARTEKRATREPKGYGRVRGPMMPRTPERAPSAAAAAAAQTTLSCLFS
jgi:hypothetical protein